MKNDQAAMAAYVRELADRLELRDWRFSVAIEPCSNPDHSAEVRLVYGRRHACITVAPITLEDSDEDVRQVLVHELVHCHTNPIRDQLDNIEAAVGKAIYTTVHNATTDVLELATEALAQALAPHLPLPPQEAHDATE